MGLPRGDVSYERSTFGITAWMMKQKIMKKKTKRKTTNQIKFGQKFAAVSKSKNNSWSRWRNACNFWNTFYWNILFALAIRCGFLLGLYTKFNGLINKVALSNNSK